MTAARTIRVVEPTDVLWKRVGAFLIDEALAVVGALVTTAVLAGFSIATFVVALLGWLAGFAAIQAFTGATPGKHVVGLRVVTASGDRAGPRRNVIRSLAWAVDGFPYVVPLAGYAAAFGDRDAQRLGDRWAGTYVVDQRFVGQPPFTVAFPADGSAPHLLETRAAYLPPGPVNPLRRPASALAEAQLAAAAAPPSLGSPAAAAAAAPGHDVVGFVAPRPTAADAAAVLALPRPAADLVLDPVSGAYTRFDADAGQWLVFDEDRRCWYPAGAEPTLVALPASAPRPPTR
jgi:uncharacterized RDD family membrane protein YckC